MLVDKNNIRFITTSSFDDDGFDCEIWNDNNCLIVVSINSEGKTEVLFNTTLGFSFDYDLLVDSLHKALNIVKERYFDFKKHKI